MAKTKGISEALAQEIIEFYKAPNSLKATKRHFQLSFARIRAVLAEHNIELHDKRTIADLGVRAAKETNLKRYGVESYSQTTAYKEKYKQSCQDKYGVDNVFQDPTIKEKIKLKTQETLLTKYGTTNVVYIPETRQKIKQTCLEKYGVDNFFKTEQAVEVRLNSNRLAIYKYKSEHFDSFPELCFYLFNLKSDSSILRNSEPFKYYFNNKWHYYIPDFKINNCFYELKGDQFLKSDGTWQCPFDHLLDDLYEAKHQCAVANNVSILYSAEYKKYMDWFFEQGYKKEDFLQ